MEKLYWEVIHKEEFDINDDYIEKILFSNGVKNKRAFLNPNISHTHNPFLFENMQEAVDLYLSKLGGKIYFEIDPDTDGYTSGAYCIQATKEISPETEIIYGLNYKKEHGIIFDDVKDMEDLSLIIISDAGSGGESFEHYEKIKEKLNVPILVLDHHEINSSLKELDYVTIVNCKDGKYPNPNLSGVGVVHKFFEAVAQKDLRFEKVLNKYLDLVSFGMVADSMDMRSLENRYYVFSGLEENNHNNELLSELCKRNADDMKLGRTMKAYGWSLAPKINGTIRYGKDKEQLDLFRAILGEQERIEYQPRRKRITDPKPPIEIHTLQETMARVAGNVKQRQDNSVRKFMTELDQAIVDQGLESDSIIIIDGSDILKKKSVSGLVANKLVSKYKRPILILKPKKDDLNVLAGSARGYEKGEIENLNDFLTRSQLFEYCEGHPNAFGVGLKKENLDEIRKKINEGLKKPSDIVVHEVDYEIDATKLTNKAVEDVANSFKIWGKGVEEPRFAITNIKIPAHEVNVYGDNNGFIKFNYNGVDYVKKYCKKNEYEILTHRERNILGKDNRILNISILSTFQFNVYENKKYPQVRIERFYSEILEEETQTITKEQKKLINEIDIDDIF